ncbi:MAG TPA: FtsW/RodA/SpoVE family cell cycle protein [Anaerovoracaceae bacterium]|nr:FtsW/RodA/SpoVE family cell cycle protein [Anaerovoracaceae bacterium]
MDGIFAWADNFIGEVREWADSITAGIAAYMANPVTFGDVYTLVARWIFPVLAVLIFVRCVLPLLHSGGSSKVWGFLEVKDAYRVPVMHWENSIGRSKLSDIVINLPFVSRSHAVFSFGENGWTVTDLGSKGGVSVNGERIEKSGGVEFGDMISFATAEFQFMPPEEGYENLEQNRKLDWLLKFSRNFVSGKTLLLILAFQLLGGIQLWLSAIDEAAGAGSGMDAGIGVWLLLPFLLLIAAECVYYFILSKTSRKYREPELLAFFLCGLNLLVTAAASPGSLTKQLVAIALGMAVYATIQYIVRDLGRGRKLKYALVACSIVLMVLNLTLGEARFGAKNWINLGFITFQPMEFVKVAFVLAGTATLDKLLTARNLTAFIGFSGACIGALILMRDLGTSVIFFVTFLVIAFMRSGDIRTIAFISAGAALGAFAVVTFLPYIASRFEAWGHVWEFADTIGYQQTRTMIAAASGGLLGVGGGNGYLVKVAAADTDLVFGILCEEWGLVTALIAVLMIVFLAFFTLLLMRGCKSSFYAISACGAASIYLIQTALNVFGSLDILPLTGVTLPFVSNGGSSMVVCWALLSFIKAADERRRPGLTEERPSDTDEKQGIDNIYELDEFSDFAIFDELKKGEGE